MSRYRILFKIIRILSGLSWDQMCLMFKKSPKKRESLLTAMQLLLLTTSKRLYHWKMTKLRKNPWSEAWNWRSPSWESAAFHWMRSISNTRAKKTKVLAWFNLLIILFLINQSILNKKKWERTNSRSCLLKILRNKTRLKRLASQWSGTPTTGSTSLPMSSTNSYKLKRVWQLIITWMTLWICRMQVNKNWTKLTLHSKHKMRFNQTRRASMV